MTSDPRFEVRFTLGVQSDLEALHRHAGETRSPAAAEALLDTLLKAVDALEAFPLRGAAPPELSALGIHDYRQLVVWPYRIVYRILGSIVYVLVIADGRRDMQALLERRLLYPGLSDEQSGAR